MALIVAFLVLTSLLALTAVTLISQRQRTVLLNRQLGTLVAEATVALRGAAPLLGAVPTRSSTIRSRAAALARLVSQAGPLISQAGPLVGEAGPLVAELQAAGLAGTVASTGSLIAQLQSAGLPGTVASTGTLVGGLQAELPAATALVAALRRQAAQLQSYQLIPAAARGIDDLHQLVALQQRALHVNQGTLATGRSTRDVARQTQATAQATLAVAQQTLLVAEQTLAHAANLDRKVGPVP